MSIEQQTFPAPQRWLLVGNPNVGKSTLFNQLTDSQQQVGNWSGVTVEQKLARTHCGEIEIELVDLPGIHDLLPPFGEQARDEQIAQQYILNQEFTGIINVVDATNLQRHLYLTLQLRELNVPMLLVINKADAAAQQQISLELTQLQQPLQCPVVLLSALDLANQQAFHQQWQLLCQQANMQHDVTSNDFQPSFQSSFQLDYGKQIESQLANVATTQPKASRPQLLATLFAQQLNHSLEQHVAQTRYQWLDALCQRAVRHHQAEHLRASERLDRLMLHPYLGLPIFLLVMYLMFMFAINVGGAFIDFFDITAGSLFVDHFGLLLEKLGSPEWLVTILAGGIGQGIQTVATFIPVIMALFLALSVLEASGYLSRAAFVVDGLMRRVGLPGQAFVPMIVGFGCSVPAIMATRTLGQERERIMTGMMAPFMSCGARLPVYALFAAAFFPESGQNLVFLLYLIGIIAAIGTGLLLRLTILPGTAGGGLMELPDYQLPSVKSSISRALNRTKSFILGAGKTIVIVVTCLNFVNAIGTDGSFGHQDSQQSVLSAISQSLTPVFAPFGVAEENWPATVGIVTGIFAKEAVVGTLNSLYANPATDEDPLPSLSESFMAALQTIPENLFGLNYADPLALDVGDVSSIAAAAEAQAVHLETYQALQLGFGSTLAAFSYLLFVLLYTPCVAAMGALVNEYGARWARFAGLWTFGLAYGVATLIYQVGSFAQQPLQASLWIATIFASFAAFVAYLKRQGQTANEVLA